ncbi:MAG: T9SS type A sorting domain-containing protein [Bacteroidetes bacterium]|nr:T9SS type A sorting domain-containing protein [Bacteroidota bacterium]
MLLKKTKLFYRLKQTDFNGETEDLKTISINPCDNKSAEIVSAAQSGSVLKIVASVSDNGVYNINIIDNSGKLITKTVLSFTSGINEISLNSHLAKGLYMININNGRENLNAKVVIQ